MLSRRSLLPAVARHALGLPDRAARALALRDLEAWLRMQFLGVASRTGIADALHGHPTLEEVAARAEVADIELLESFLAVGIALGELRERAGRYHVRGRRLRAVVGEARDVRGLVEEVVAYDGPIYANLGAHLRGAPPSDYVEGVGRAVAEASRLAEPVLAPVVQAVVREVRPASVLDVGCGSGVYLRHVRQAAPEASVLGIDVNPEVVAATPGARCLDLFEVVGRFDLVLLLQNVYYWPPEERPRVFARLRELAPVAVVATAVRRGQAFNHHLDLVLRVTRGNWRLPTEDELEEGLRAAGFSSVEVVEPVPATGLVVAVAR